MIFDRFANLKYMETGIFGQGYFSQIQYGKHENDTRIYTKPISRR